MKPTAVLRDGVVYRIYSSRQEAELEALRGWGSSLPDITFHLWPPSDEEVNSILAEAQRDDWHRLTTRFHIF